MRVILFIAVILLAGFSTYGQTDDPPQPCTLKIAQAPAIRGVKLGMTVDELVALFPGSSESFNLKQSLAAAEGYPNFGETGFGIHPANWGNKERFDGITDYYFRLFDRRVFIMSVNYSQFPSGARWKTTDDLIQRFSDALHLPGPRAWGTDPMSSEQKKLKCDGFEVTVRAGDHGTITFYTGNWEGVKRERLAAFEEQKRNEFRP
ncbi:MAG TPA: hypothetical protein VE961_25815 [Pyrinomonadaceae bacterium]|nr:hypothetical protein [Pyrinomonadaceae bacterium]